MTDIKFSFGAEQFNRIFPFYILIDNELRIMATGNSLKKLLPVAEGDLFTRHFRIKNPEIVIEDFKALKYLTGELIILETADAGKNALQGQLEYLQDTDTLLFIGEPVLYSLEKVNEIGLTVSDFAPHDPTVDLLKTIQSQTAIVLKKDAEQQNTLQDETSKMFSQLMTNFSNAILVEDEHKKIILVNDLFCNLFSIKETPGQLTGQDSPLTTFALSHLFKSAEEYADRINKLLSLKETVINEVLEMKDGKLIKMDFIPVYLDNNYKGNLWKISDVTDNILFHKEMERQRVFYETILNEIPADIAVLDNKHRYLFLNPVAIKDPAVRKWIIGKTDHEYVKFRKKPLKIAEERMMRFNEAVSTRKQIDWEEEIIKPNGSSEHHLRKLYPVFNPSGDLEMMIGYGVNITDRKKQEELLKLNEKRYRDIFEFSQALICTHDLNGKILSVNKASADTLEYSKEELVGSKLSFLIPDKYRSAFDERYLTDVTNNKKSEGILQVLTKSGKLLYLLYHNYLVTEKDNEPYVIGFSQNITERIKAEEALKRSEDKYHSLIGNMSLGMVEADNEERIIFLNHSFCEMSGYEYDELIGRNVYDLFLNKKGQELLKEKSELRKAGISDSYEIMIKNKRGEMKWWLVSGAPHYNEDGTLRGSIGVFLDISRQKMLEDELRDAKTQADRSARSKEVFLANMSHEIRTPINAIMGLGKLLGKSGLNKQQHYFLNSMLTATENLLVIVNEVLDFSKIEAGKITVENIGFDVHQLLLNAITVFNYKAEEKGLAILHEFDENIAPILKGDPFRINQVIMNLLSNSIKFTEKGTITVKTTLAGKQKSSQKIEITVSDTGIGMSEDYLEHMFEKFTQEDESVARRFGGTGLGMSISKQLVELMGGTMTVKSKKNAGSSFSLLFDMRIGSAKDLPKKEEVTGDTDILHDKNILLVEDNEMNRLVASTILQQFGVNITEAENGQVAIDILRRQSFDLILMDVQMPVMDGYQATGIIRNEMKKITPVIALTANALKGEEEKCLDAGMNDFITKPYQEEKMLNIITKWLGKIHNKKYIAKKKFHEMDALYDLKILETLSRGNEEFVMRMVKLFVREIPVSVMKIMNAYENNDLDTVKFYAHRIKPTIINMNINQVKTDILEIELLAAKKQKSDELKEMIDRLDQITGLVIEKLKLEYNLPE